MSSYENKGGPKVSHNGNQSTSYTCDGSRNTNGQPTVVVPKVINNEYALGKQPATSGTKVT